MALTTVGRAGQSDSTREVPLKITSFADEDAEEWASFAETCPECWLHHRPEWMTGSASIHGEDLSFSVRRANELVGLCVLHKRRHGLGAILNGPGLALASVPDAAQVRKAAGEELRALGIRAGCQAIQFNLPPLAPALCAIRYVNSPLAQLGFSFGVRGPSLDYEAGYCSIIDLKRPTKEILTGFSKGNRASVVRCGKKGVEARFMTGANFSEGAWRDFVSVYEATRVRNRLAPKSPMYLQFLESMCRKGHLFVASAYLGKNCIATILLEICKRGANYLEGGCLEEGLQIGSMAFVHFGAMEQLRSLGFTRYSMGTTIPVASGKDAQIGDFKKRFGGDRHDYLAGELVLDRRAHMTRILVPAALARYRVIPPGLGAVARKLRHIIGS